MIIKTSPSIPKNAKAIVIPTIVDSKLLTSIDEKYGINSNNFFDSVELKANKTLQFYSNEKKAMIFLVQLDSTLLFKKVENQIKKFAFQYRSELPSMVAIDLGFLLGQSDTTNIDSTLEAIANGLVLSTYQIGLYKSEQKNKSDFFKKNTSVTFVFPKNTSYTQAIKQGQAMAQTQLQILDLVNAPGNKATPTMLANWAKKSGKTNGYKVRVINKAQAKKLGLHALLAVNKGSEYPPAFIIMEYQPKKLTRKKLPTIGLVGKGVTFDTGGLSIKGNMNMHYMKSDMGGAAAVFGAMEMIAKQQLQAKVIGIVPATDNCVDATAVKPGDVIQSYAGKTHRNH